MRKEIIISKIKHKKHGILVNLNDVRDFKKLINIEDVIKNDVLAYITYKKIPNIYKYDYDYRKPCKFKYNNEIMDTVLFGKDNIQKFIDILLYFRRTQMHSVMNCIKKLNASYGNNKIYNVCDIINHVYHIDIKNRDDNIRMLSEITSYMRGEYSYDKLFLNLEKNNSIIDRETIKDIQANINQYALAFYDCYVQN